MTDANTVNLAAVKRGFSDPGQESQYLFRQLMDVIAEPGLVHDLSAAPEAPKGISRATGGIALTLFDFETPVWLCQALRGGETEAWIRFHCNSPLVLEPSEAQFAILSGGSYEPLMNFNQGDPKYPDRSTTVILEVEAFSDGNTKRLSGPGIESHRDISIKGLPDAFWSDALENSKQFQTGVDMFLTAGDSVMGLPRSTHIAQQEGNQ